MKKVLGIDTSCYTTSVALWGKDGRLLNEKRQLLEVPAGHRGLQQSQAFFQHVRMLPQLLEILNKGELENICRIVVSDRPRNQADAYLPVFTAGARVAEALACVTGAALTYTDHQTNHCLAGLIDAQHVLDQDLLVCHLSGGTTEMVYLPEPRATLKRCGAQSKGFCGLEEQVLGRSLDLAVGQVVDRIGVAAGLAFPAGAAMEQQSCGSQTEALLPFPEHFKGLDCNLSGFEAYGLNYLKKDYDPGLIFKSLFHGIGVWLGHWAMKGCAATQAKGVLFVGGVASNLQVRQTTLTVLHEASTAPLCYFAAPDFSRDHAVGNACLGGILEGWQ